jgi:ornithine cyclodeaminase/alanine dehydrogenase-like protein (mu-crystallin family)
MKQTGSSFILLPLREEVAMPILLLTEEDVRQVLTMDMALEAVEDGLRKYALEEGQNIPRARVQTDHAMLHVMSASAKTLGVLGAKLYITSKKGSQFHIALYDAKAGTLLAFIQADFLSQMRTGAASGVATEYMARPESSEVGLFGSGKQARAQLLAVCQVRKITRVQVYSPNEDHRRRFSAEMSDQCRTEVEPVPRPEMAAEDKDIIITATTQPRAGPQWQLDRGRHAPECHRFQFLD